MARWEFTGATREVHREEDEKVITVRQIRATCDLERYSNSGSARYDIPAGTLGGWIEEEENLPQDGNAWVGENATVYGDSVVKESAAVGGCAVIDSSEISGYATVFGGAVVRLSRIGGNAKVYDCACLCRCAVTENARVCGSARIENRRQRPAREIVVTGNAEISGNAVIVTSEALLHGVLVGDNAKIGENARVESAVSDLIIMDSADISGHAFIAGSGFIRGHAVISGYSFLIGSLAISGNAVIEIPRNQDYIDYALPYVSLGEGANITRMDDFLVTGPFHGAGRNMFLTFAMDSGGGMHMYTRWSRTPIHFDIRNAKKFQKQLCSCIYIPEDSIAEIVAAYRYARACLLARKRQKKGT